MDYGPSGKCVLLRAIGLNNAVGLGPEASAICLIAAFGPGGRLPRGLGHVDDARSGLREVSAKQTHVRNRRKTHGYVASRYLASGLSPLATDPKVVCRALADKPGGDLIRRVVSGGQPLRTVLLGAPALPVLSRPPGPGSRSGPGRAARLPGLASSSAPRGTG